MGIPSAGTTAGSDPPQGDDRTDEPPTLGKGRHRRPSRGLGPHTSALTTGRDDARVARPEVAVRELVLAGSWLIERLRPITPSVRPARLAEIHANAYRCRHRGRTVGPAGRVDELTDEPDRESDADHHPHQAHRATSTSGKVHRRGPPPEEPANVPWGDNEGTPEWYATRERGTFEPARISVEKMLAGTFPSGESPIGRRGRGMVATPRKVREFAVVDLPGEQIADLRETGRPTMLTDTDDRSNLTAPPFHHDAAGSRGQGIVGEDWRTAQATEWTPSPAICRPRAKSSGTTGGRHPRGRRRRSVNLNGGAGTTSDGAPCGMRRRSPGPAARGGASPGRGR